LEWCKRWPSTEKLGNSLHHRALQKRGLDTGLILNVQWDVPYPFKQLEGSSHEKHMRVGIFGGITIFDRYASSCRNK
jgi:hypothetical protein